MISIEYLERLELSEYQISSLMRALERETKYRRLLESEHVMHIEAIVSHTSQEELDRMDFNNEELMREKIRIEYDDMILPRYKKKSQLFKSEHM